MGHLAKPLPLAATALGVDPEAPPSGRPGDWGRADWQLAVDLRRELVEAGAKMPTRG